MVKTRRGLNTLGKSTKGKKKGVGPSDDKCIEVEALVVNQEAQKAEGQKSKVKGKGSKASVSTSMEGEQVFSPTPIRSIPPTSATHNVTQGEVPENS
ncbi:hypothetical protein LIER_01848 [Lithospermum erythrorhizon]|uniref:Uncharacterized protein n=1 Tax=Lithospermum erythrorhizon TaxID=34254 RepID=A0AAV3NNM5_LITER